MAEPLNHLCFDVPIMGKDGFIYSQEPPGRFVLAATATYNDGTLEVGFIPLDTDGVNMVPIGRHNRTTGRSIYGVSSPLAYEINRVDGGKEIRVGATSMVNPDHKLDARIIGGVAGLLSGCGFDGLETDISADPFVLRVPVQTRDLADTYDYTHTLETILFPEIDCGVLALGALEAALAVMTEVHEYPLNEVTTNI